MFTDLVGKFCRTFSCKFIIDLLSFSYVFETKSILRWLAEVRTCFRLLKQVWKTHGKRMMKNFFHLFQRQVCAIAVAKCVLAADKTAKEVLRRHSSESQMVSFCWTNMQVFENTPLINATISLHFVIPLVSFSWSNRDISRCVLFIFSLRILRDIFGFLES